MAYIKGKAGGPIHTQYTHTYIDRYDFKVFGLRMEWARSDRQTVAYILYHAPPTWWLAPGTIHSCMGREMVISEGLHTYRHEREEKGEVAPLGRAEGGLWPLRLKSLARPLGVS